MIKLYNLVNLFRDMEKYPGNVDTLSALHFELKAKTPDQLNAIRETMRKLEEVIVTELTNRD